MNGLGTALILFFLALILFGSRRLILLALFGIVCYVPENQQILVAGFHFTGIRIAFLVALVKVLIRRDYQNVMLTGIDKALLAYALTLAAVGILREGTLAEVVFCFGKTYDILLTYFVCRCLLASFEDVKAALFSLAWLVVPLSFLMAREAVTAYDPFSSMGLIHDLDRRHGLFRAQGPFQSPILAGVFGATMVPLFAGLYALGKRRALLIIGIAASIMITLTSLSSAPILALFLDVTCLACWVLRERMRTIRWLIVAAIVGLQIVMKGDVWFIFGHLSHLTGGGGEYRSELIDSAIHDFGRWWLLGFKDTGQWTANHLANGAADITNQYIRDAVDGGIWALTLLIVVLTRCFGQLGKARKRVRFESGPDYQFSEEWFLWCLGGALVVHAVTILSVEYFDQVKVSWFMLLAMISGLTSEFLNREAGSTTVSIEENEFSDLSRDPNKNLLETDGGLTNSEAT